MRDLTVLSLLLPATIGSATAQQPSIPVVENTRPAWERGKEWRIAAQPSLDIGKVEAEPEYELSQIRGMLRLQDGTIVVANQQSELRYYDKNGKYIRTAGRRGGGPGEFFQIMGLLLLRDGTIGVKDFRNGIQVYSPDGRFIRRQAFPGDVLFPPDAVFDDASMIAGAWPQPRAGMTEIYTDSLTLKRYTANGDEQVIGRYPAARFAPNPRYPRSDQMHIGPVLTQVASGQNWYVGFPERWEITQYTTAGKPVRAIRRAWQPIEITAAEREAFRDARVNRAGEGGGQVSPSIRAQRESMYVDEAFAKTLPAYGRLLVAAGSFLWVQEPTRPRDIPLGTGIASKKPQEWSVFDPAGRWLGQVQTPGNFWVFEIGSDYVLGLWRDELDVEHVRQYALIKPR